MREIHPQDNEGSETNNEETQRLSWAERFPDLAAIAHEGWKDTVDLSLDKAYEQAKEAFNDAIRQGISDEEVLSGLEGRIDEADKRFRLYRDLAFGKNHFRNEQ